MYKIVRSNYCYYREEYVLDLTDEYVTNFNNWFHSRTHQAYLGEIEITPKMMIDAFQWNEVDWDRDIVLHYTWDETQTCTTRLVDFIRDVLNEDVWDCEYDLEFVESYDTEDNVEEVNLDDYTN